MRYVWFDYKFWNYEHTYGYEPFAIPFSDLGEKIVFAGVRFSDTKCCIERNDFFVIFKAEVFGRELDRISGLIGVHIDL